MAARNAMRRLVAPFINDSGCAKGTWKAQLSIRALCTATDTAAQGSKDAVQVRRGRDKSQAPATTQNRSSWPRSLFPSLLSPFSQPTSLAAMLDTVDRLFDSAFLSPISDTSRSIGNNRMPWDVIEDEKSFKLRVDVPGFMKDEVKVFVEDRDLVIKAQHNPEEIDDWAYRSYGTLNMRIKLPDNVDLESIKASLKNGVLKVEAPKVEGKREKKEINIE